MPERGMSIPLKPCPFCGRAPKVRDRASDLEGGWVWFIQCACDSFSARVHQYGYTEEQAAARWNTRHGEAAK